MRAVVQLGLSRKRSRRNRAAAQTGPSRRPPAESAFREAEMLIKLFKNLFVSLRASSKSIFHKVSLFVF